MASAGDERHNGVLRDLLIMALLVGCHSGTHAKSTLGTFSPNCEEKLAPGSLIIIREVKENDEKKQTISVGSRGFH
jgi:hypothetical protein